MMASFAAGAVRDHTLLDRLAGQMPPNVREQVQIVLQSDPFNLRMIARIKLPNGMTRDEPLDPVNPELSKETLGFLALLVP